jgi:hypothetical protein
VQGYKFNVFYPDLIDKTQVRPLPPSLPPSLLPSLCVCVRVKRLFLPLPKTVQGYKFNVFYPDLIDKTQVGREGGREGWEEELGRQAANDC